MIQDSRFKNKKIAIAAVILILIMPVSVGADLIPCDGSEASPCDFNALMTLVNNIINWVATISIPVAAAVFAWAGFKLMTSGAVDQKTEAKKMLWKVFWGLVLILAAWLIVTTITNTLLSDSFRQSVPIEGV